MENIEKLIEPLQQWALENKEERGVLVIAADGEKQGCTLTGAMFNVSRSIALQASKTPEVHRVLLMGLFAATKNNRFLSLRARLIAWLLK